VELDPEQYERLKTVSAPALGIPHDGGHAIRDSVLGGQSSNFTVRRPREAPAGEPRLTTSASRHRSTDRRWGADIDAACPG
jgi:hypothetical protein